MKMTKNRTINQQSRSAAMLDYDHLYKRIPTGGVCFYCGGDAQTGDHVPPLSTVRKRDPGALLWLVPSCQRCNHLLGKSQVVDLKKRREYVLRKRVEAGDEITLVERVSEMHVWVMPPLHDEDRELIGKTVEAISGGALEYVEGRLGGDLRRTVLAFIMHQDERVCRGILSGMIGRALRSEEFIWGFGLIPSMLSPDPRILNYD